MKGHLDNSTITYDRNAIQHNVSWGHNRYFLYCPHCANILTLEVHVLKLLYYKLLVLLDGGLTRISGRSRIAQIKYPLVASHVMSNYISGTPMT